MRTLPSPRAGASHVTVRAMCDGVDQTFIVSEGLSKTLCEIDDVASPTRQKALLKRKGFIVRFIFRSTQACDQQSVDSVVNESVSRLGQTLSVSKLPAVNPEYSLAWPGETILMMPHRQDRRLAKHVDIRNSLKGRQIRFVMLVAPLMSTVSSFAEVLMQLWPMTDLAWAPLNCWCRRWCKCRPQSSSWLLRLEGANASVPVLASK